MSEPERTDPVLRSMAGQNLLDMPDTTEMGIAILLAALGHAFAVGDLDEFDPCDAALILELFGIR